MQDQDIFGARYPAIFGSDVAGEVMQTGQGVYHLQVGQKVIAYVLSRTYPPRKQRKRGEYPAHGMSD